MPSLKELKKQNAKWRVIATSFNGNPVPENEQGASYYMRESGMRSPQAAWGYFVKTGMYTVRVETREEGGDWTEVPNYEW